MHGIAATWTCFLLLAAVTGNNSTNQSASPEILELKKMDIYRDSVTLSGFSAGGSMATQTHVAHSSLFSGIAIFNQAFYMCGYASLLRYALGCGTYGLGLFKYHVKHSVNNAKEFEKTNEIDSLKNLESQKVFLWMGARDAYVAIDSVEKNVNFYSDVGVNPKNIKYTLFDNASHCLPTANFGAPCTADAKDTFYLGNCNWSGPYHALSYIMNRDDLVEAHYDRKRLKLFSQKSLYEGENIKDIAMGEVGFIYIPEKCETEKCQLHVNFHGCNEWELQLAKEYIKHSGYLRVAEGNNIIMIFPLTTKTNKNMDGCWDFFSYLPYIGTKKAPQVRLVERILKRVLDGV